ncbi:MAG: (Fe-S)-binding protein [Thermoanaerobaculia bacterium]
MELQKKIDKMHVLRKGGAAYDFARQAVRDVVRPLHEGPAIRISDAAAEPAEASTPAAEPTAASPAPAETSPRTEAPAPLPAPTGASADAAFHDQALTLAERMKLAEESGGGVVAKMWASLAQTDCGACGWDCEGYAKALDAGEEKDISLCVPGEAETIETLKKLMAEAGREYTVGAA